MANLREIRRRIGGVKNTSKITQAMKMVSAAKLKRAQDAIESSRPYFNKLEDILSNLVEAVGETYSHPVLEKRADIKNIAVVVISSDRGLCGGFNTQVFRYAKELINNDIAKEYPNAKISLIPVGKKSTQNYNKAEYPIIKSFPGIFTDLNFDVAVDVIGQVKDRFLNGEIDKVIIVYNSFVNIVRQKPLHQQVLPIESLNTPNIETKKSANIDYIFEPNQAEILDELLPKIINLTMWKGLLESAAAEQAARMMAMENATTNAKELIRSLNLVYNRERQAAITTEMLEIVGGAEALNN